MKISKAISSIQNFLIKYKIVFFIMFICYMIFVYIKVFKLAIADVATFKYTQPSGDNQYFGAIYFWHKNIDPFDAFLNHKANFTAPNYMHLLYILYYPLTFIEWGVFKKVWAIISLLCFIANMILFYKHYKNFNFLMIFAFLAFLANGFPAVIALGQFACILSLALSIAYLYRSHFVICGIALSIVFIKYSFGVPILLAFFLAGFKNTSMIKAVIVAAIIHLLAIVVFYIKFGSSFLIVALEPLLVARMSTGSGPADLLSFFRSINGNDIFSQISLIITLAIIFLIYIVYILKNNKYLSDCAIISSSVVLSLGVFFHLGYDNYVFLSAFLILLDRFRFTHKPFIFLFCIVMILWFDQRFGTYFGIHTFFMNHYGIDLTWGGPMPPIFTFIFAVLTIIGAFYILFFDKNYLYLKNKNQK